MKNLTLMLLALTMVSCALAELEQKSKRKQSTDKKQQLPEELLPDQQRSVQKYVMSKDFWPGHHYHRTTITVDNPKFTQTETELWDICKGPVLEHLITYKGNKTGRVVYLRTPVTFYTDSGFKRDVYVSKGICRELALYASRGKETEKVDGVRQMRHRLKRLVIDMVYTEKPFASRLIFDSKYQGVKFQVD